MKKQKQALAVILLILQIALTIAQLVDPLSNTAPVINVSGIDNTVIVLNIGD